MPESPQLRPVRERVEEALARCRPFLHLDAGDVELHAIGEDGVVEVRFQGTCTDCPMSKMTLRAGIERAILRSAPEIKRVELVR